MSTEESKKETTNSFKVFARAFRRFMVKLLDIREGTDIPETIDKIKEGIEVKSHTAWILIFSIFIASIGLNVSSTAVVIGAMLVSPLMGPILGIGLSVGTNDIDTLKSSLRNLGIMVGLSIVSSFLFFSIPIFQEATPEILARTKPDIRDVLIAISGGLALAVALSRRKELTNTIAGIAIATALMPPLCTAGYGLAVWNLQYFGGAMFLFTINALFIAIATFGIVKFLHFPVVRYLDSASRRRISQVVSIISLIIIAGSIYQFILLFRVNTWNSNARKFVSDMQRETGVGIIKETPDYRTKTISLAILGERMDSQSREKWSNRMEEYGLKGTTLKIDQDNQASKLLDKVKTLENLYVTNQGFITAKEKTIEDKDKEIRELNRLVNYYKSQQIPFLQVAREAKINNPELNQITFARKITSSFDNQVDTLAVFQVKWNDSIRVNKSERDERLKEWLKARLNIDSLIIEE
ncbi:DUF389 domain-containing protein, partial [Flavobacteriaceae bacterium]|nr:DUF389 domain-containing protein [Flavobacteriaceae bacterium]